MRASLTLALALAAPLPAFGEEALPELSLPEIEVPSTRLREPGEGGDSLPAFGTSILVDSRPGVQSGVEDLLEGQTGLDVRAFGSPGHYSLLSVRGADPAHTLVSLDGVPLVDPNAGPFDLSGIPAFLIERIEVYRGQAPARLGASGIGGRLNIITRRPHADVLQASASAGSFDSYRAGVRGAAVSGPWEALAAIEGFASSGRFDFKDDNATPYNPDDDAEVTRANNDVSHAALLARGRYSAPGGRWMAELLAEGFRKEQGLAGFSSNQSQDARLGHQRGMLAATLQAPRWMQGLDDSFLRAYLRHQQDHFEDPQGEVGIGRQDRTGRFTQTGIHGYAETVPTPIGRFGFGLRGEVERFLEAEKMDQLADPLHARNHLEAMVEDRWHVLDTLEIALAWRGDRWHSAFDASAMPDVQALESRDVTEWRNSPYAGIKWRATDSLAFRANAGRYHRAPGFLELFGNRGAVAGNPELKPESATNWDAGLTGGLDLGGGKACLFVEAAWFENRAKDLIAFVQNSQLTSKAQNIGKAVTRGFEGRLELDHSGIVQLEAGYTRLFSEDRSEAAYLRGNDLPHRPRHSMSALSRLNLPFAGLFHRFQYQSRQSLDRANVRWAPARRSHDAGASFPLGAFRLTLEARNLRDERQQDYIGYPQPGRSFWAVLDWRWEDKPE